MRWTSWNESRFASRSEISAATAATMRRKAAVGMPILAAATRTTIASDSPPATMRISRPKSTMSATQRILAVRGATAAGRRLVSPLTDSLPASHSGLIRHGRYSRTYAPRGTDPARPDARPSASPTGATKAPSGSLAIEDGRGVVQVTGKGVVVGRVEKGSLRITDLTPADQWSPYVNGVPRGKVVWLKGRDISFRVSAGRYRIVATGEGVSISARGTGVGGPRRRSRPRRRHGVLPSR